MEPELRCKRCRRLIDVPPGTTGTVRARCRRCGRFQTVVLPADPPRR